MKIYKQVSVRVVRVVREVFLLASDESDINNDNHWTDNY